MLKKVVVAICFWLFVKNVFFRWKDKEEEGHVEDSVVTVVVKDGVQTGQPRVVIVETVSIATQTEKIANLAAAVQVCRFFFAFKKMVWKFLKKKKLKAKI